MSLQLILGSSGSGKSYQLYQEVIKKSIENENVNYLIIVPEQFTLQTQKDIIEKHPYHGTMNIDILSFLRLAHRVFDEVGGNERQVLEDTGKSMVIRKIISLKKDDLLLFGHESGRAGFINELKSLISELCQYSITVKELEQIRESVKEKPMLYNKLHDIIIIYQGFKDYLKEKYITAEEVLDLLCEVINKSELIKNSVISFDGFTGFTPAQYKLLTLLMKRAKKVLVTVTIDEREDISRVGEEYKLFHLSKKTIHHLYKIAEDNKIPIEKPRYPANESNGIVYRFRKHPALAILEKNIFRYPIRTYKKEQKDIRIHLARNSKHEISFAVREILKLVREENYRYQDIAIVTGNIEEYGRLLEREFDKSNISYFIDHNRELLNNPFVEMLRSLLDIFKHNFDYESVFRFLRCGLVNVSSEEIDILENYIIAFGIRGSNRWGTAWTKNYKGQPEGQINRINEIRQDFIDELLPLANILLDKDKTVKDNTIALYEYIIKLDIATKLENYREEFTEKGMLSTAKEYQQIYGIVMELFEKLVELLGDEKLPINEYIDVLEAGLGEGKVGVIPPGLDQIVVGDIERTRLKDIKALFFVGVNDGIIPKSGGNGGILSDLDREVLVDHEVEMAPTRREAAYMEQFYLYLNMTKPQERLYITYSKLDEEGKTRRPSYLIGTLQKLFPKIQIIDEEIEREELEYVLGSDKGMDYLISGLRNYGSGEVSAYWKEIFCYYNNKEEYKKVISELIRGAYSINNEIGLSKEIAKELYGTTLLGSVTRFEQFAACAFAHYVKYGLNLQERVEYRLAIPDIGNLFHNAIERFSKKVSSSEYNWHTLPEELRDEWATECVREAAEDIHNSIFSSSKRYEYIIERVDRITKRTLWALCDQIRKGDFEPIGSEVYFSEKARLDSLAFPIADGGLIQLRGIIDRLDLYEEDDKLMVKVIDYKSGRTSFDLLSIYYGLQLQLAIYLNAALELLKRENKDKEIIPAGILYYHIEDPIVDKNSNITASILKELRMDGIVNENIEVIKHLDHNFKAPDDTIAPSIKSNVIPVETKKDGTISQRSSVAKTKDLNSMEDYVKNIVQQFGTRILKGDTRIEPYQLKKKIACEYCPYKGVCGFDLGLEGYFYRKLPTFKDNEIWEEIIRKQTKEKSEGDL